MSSARKRAAIYKAEKRAEHLQSALLLAQHQYDVMKAISEELARRLDAARGALTELVDLKSMKERIETADLCTYSVDDAEAAQRLAEEYEQRKPLAWKAARDLVSNAE